MLLKTGLMELEKRIKMVEVECAVMVEWHVCSRET